MQDLIEAYLSVYDDIIDEKRLFPGAPGYSLSFPLKNKDEIVNKLRELAAMRAELYGQTRKKSAKLNDKPNENEKPTRKRTTRLSDVRIGESYDFYDVVLDYLLDEGYCESEENAISMMAAMSEEWIDSIING